MSGFETLIAGLAIFIAIHFISFTYALRERLVGLLGAVGHRVLHSSLSVLGLYLIVTGFAARPMEHGLEVPVWGMGAPLIGMPLVFILMAGFVFKGDFLRVTRHPMLLAVTLFSFLHLLANGDKGSVILFGSFLVWALISIPMCEAKYARMHPEEAKFTFQSTSVLPFLAIFQGRASAKAGDRAVLKSTAVGLALYFAVAYAHPYFTGMAVLPIG
ncbi:MAG: hypothetical protein KAI28_00900 [Sphingomonadales bacterium]|nr:hypothetical protein [Sphingomonadales bacterium]